MFKSVTILPFLTVKSLKVMRHTNLNTRLQDFTINDPTGGQIETIGFSNPCPGVDDLVFICADDTRVLNVELRARVLPSNVVKKRLREKVEEFTSRMGRAPARKEIRDLKEDLIATMLPNAFIRATHVLVMFKKDNVYIGTPRSSLAEEIAVLLRSVVGYDELQYGKTNVDPEKWMTGLCIESDSDNFAIGDSGLLKRSKAAVRVKDLSLDTNQIAEYLHDGFTVRELALEWEGGIKFTMTDLFVLKRLKFTDVITGSDDAATDFEGTVALTCGSLDRLVAELVTVMPKLVQEDDEL